MQLVFQPAEEGGGGARVDDRRRPVPALPDGAHLRLAQLAGPAAGTVAVHEGPVMAAGARFEIAFEGHAGHAALPHLTRDPMLGAGHCIVALQSLVSRNVDPLDAGVVSVTVAEAGEAQNQVPQRAVLKGTARWLSRRDRRRAGGRASAASPTASPRPTGWRPRSRSGAAWRSTANHPAERDARGRGGRRGDRGPARPAAGDDRRGFLLASCRRCPAPSCGSATAAREGGRELHNPSYDFNDAILPVASGWLAEVAKRALAAPG